MFSCYAFVLLWTVSLSLLTKPYIVLLVYSVSLV